MKAHKKLVNITGIIFLTGIDQFIKLLVIRSLKGNHNIVLIKGVLELEYFENFGAAFNSLVGKRVLLICLTALVTVFLIWKLFQLPEEKKYFGMRFCICLIIGGALGNLTDRFARGYVVDFIYFSLIDYPKFNFADMCVVTGVVMLGLLLFFYYKEEDVDFLLTLRGKGGN